MGYFKRYWNESAGAGDPRDIWGPSWWYLEADLSGNVTRQITTYESGPTIRYDETNLDDEFGGLIDQRIDLVEFLPFEIDQKEFDELWHSKSVINAKPDRRDNS